MFLDNLKTTTKNTDSRSLKYHQYLYRGIIPDSMYFIRKFPPSPQMLRTELSPELPIFHLSYKAAPALVQHRQFILQETCIWGAESVHNGLPCLVCSHHAGLVAADALFQFLRQITHHPFPPFHQTFQIPYMHPIVQHQFKSFRNKFLGGLFMFVTTQFWTS